MPNLNAIIFSNLYHQVTIDRARSFSMEQKYSNKIRFSICIYFSSSIFDTRRTCFFQSSWKFYILSPLFYISRAIYSDRRNGNSGYLIPRAPSLSIQGLLSPISRRFGTNLRSWSSPTSSVILSSMNSKVTCIQFLFEIQIYNRRHAKPFGNYKFKAIYENLREWIGRHPSSKSTERNSIDRTRSQNPSRKMNPPTD